MHGHLKYDISAERLQLSSLKVDIVKLAKA